MCLLPLFFAALFMQTEGLEGLPRRVLSHVQHSF